MGSGVSSEPVVNVPNEPLNFSQLYGVWWLVAGYPPFSFLKARFIFNYGGFGNVDFYYSDGDINPVQNPCNPVRSPTRKMTVVSAVLYVDLTKNNLLRIQQSVGKRDIVTEEFIILQLTPYYVILLRTDRTKVYIMSRSSLLDPSLIPPILNVLTRYGLDCRLVVAPKENIGKIENVIATPAPCAPCTPCPSEPIRPVIQVTPTVTQTRCNVSRCEIDEPFYQ